MDSAPPDDGFLWDLHLHSHGSRDSLSSVRTIARNLKKKGFHGFALTDHDTIRCWKEARAAACEFKLHFIPGMEITCFDAEMRRVELIGLFLNRKVKGGYILETAERIREEGGITVVPHPFDFFRAGFPEFAKYRKYFNAVEVFNARTHDKARLIKAFEQAKAAGLAMTGGSDAHAAFEAGAGWTWTPWTGEEGLRKAILKKRTVAGGRISSRAVHIVSTMSKLKIIPAKLKQL
ncbi:MAG: PHP domain-containing protein [Thermoplasmata archaeon]